MALRVAAPKNASATVIFLHGFGDSGAGWSFLAKQCHELPALQHVNFVFPNAPERFYALLGDKSTGWFDLRAFGKDIRSSSVDEKGILASVDLVRSYVKDEISSGISPKKIVIGGFSQGAAIAEVMSLLCKEHLLAGFLGLSGFLPITETLEKKQSMVNRNTPVLLCHGTYDEIVPPAESLHAKEFMEKVAGRTSVDLKTYKGLAHSADDEEIADIIAFFEKVLN